MINQSCFNPYRSLLVVYVCIIGLPGIFDCYTLTQAGNFCTFIASCSQNCSFFGYTGFVVIHAPFYIIPTILYLAMYIKSRKMASSTSVSSSNGSSNTAHMTIFLLFIISCLCYFPNIAAVVVLQIVIAVRGYSISLGIMLFILGTLCLFFQWRTPLLSFASATSRRSL